MCSSDLQWQMVDGAVRFEIWVNGDTEGAKFIYRTDLTSNSFQVVSPLGAGRTYRMWVRAVSSDNRTTAWSDTYVLRVAQAETEEETDRSDGPSDFVTGLVQTDLFMVFGQQPEHSVAPRSIVEREKSPIEPTSSPAVLENQHHERDSVTLRSEEHHV